MAAPAAEFDGSAAAQTDREVAAQGLVTGAEAPAAGGEKPVVSASSASSSASAAATAEEDASVTAIADTPRSKHKGIRRGCRDVKEFVLDKPLGGGTYGDVVVAFDKDTGEKVALKKVKMTMNGMFSEGVRLALSGTSVAAPHRSRCSSRAWL
jgi:hypothetical protein